MKKKIKSYFCSEQDCIAAFLRIEENKTNSECLSVGWALKKNKPRDPIKLEVKEKLINMYLEEDLNDEEFNEKKQNDYTVYSLSKSINESVFDDEIENIINSVSKKEEVFKDESEILKRETRRRRL
uniref:Uncharacterized protein n=1 Tax=Strongyloides venezuelensis TaxID=75913 RepID=A0A0K0FGK3_STRVS